MLYVVCQRCVRQLRPVQVQSLQRLPRAVKATPKRASITTSHNTTASLAALTSTAMLAST